MEAAEGLPRRALPRRLLRQVAQPLTRMVLAGGLREPPEGAQLPPPARVGCGLAGSDCRERELDGLGGRLRALGAVDVPARLEHDRRPPEREREADLGERAVAA